MPVCRRPGCVAQSVDGESCAIHRDGLGRVCEPCRGTGNYNYVDPHGRASASPCDRCGGTGLKDAKVSHRSSKRDDLVDARGLILEAEK